MPAENLTKDVSTRICNHMNSDHENAIGQYAIHYGGIKKFKKAIMKNITCEYFELEVDDQMIKIYFDHTLQSSEDAHQTLVAMLKSISKPI